MGSRIAVLTGKNIKANCPNTFGPCTSTGFPELFLLICLSMGVLILTIIQSRFTVITFPIKSSYDADQFFKTQLGVKLGGLSSLLDVTQHCSLAVLSLSPEINPFFISSSSVMQLWRKSISCDLLKKNTDILLHIRYLDVFLFCF